MHDDLTANWRDCLTDLNFNNSSVGVARTNSDLCYDTFAVRSDFEDSGIKIDCDYFKGIINETVKKYIEEEDCTEEDSTTPIIEKYKIKHR